MTATAAPPAAPAAGPNRPAAGRRRTVPTVVGLLVAGLVVGWQRANSAYADSDILWAIRSGLDLLDDGRLPRSDPYSWTFGGHEWVPNSWGWNVVLGLAYRVGGFTAVALLGVVAVCGLAVLTGSLGRRVGANAPMQVLVFLAVGGTFALYLYPRPQLVDPPAVLAVLLLVPGAVRGDRRTVLRHGAALVVVHVAWMNLHSSAMLGPVLVAAAGAGFVLASPSVRGRTARRVVALAAACTLACLATPYGVAPFTHASQVRAASAGLITEWLPVGFGSPAQLLAVVALALALPAAWHAWRLRRLDLIAALLVLSIASASAVRFAPLLAVVATPLLAGACSRLPIREFLAARAWKAVVAVLVLACVARSGEFGEPGLQNYPQALAAQLPAGCRLVNDYSSGGGIELTRPDVPVAIDSRNDVYGRDFQLRLMRILADPAVGTAFVRTHHVTCVLASSRSGLVTALRSDPQWRVVDTDGVRTLLVRR